MAARVRQWWGKTFQRGKVERRLVYWQCYRCGEEWTTERLWWPYDSTRTNFETLAIVTPRCPNGHTIVFRKSGKEAA